MTDRPANPNADFYEIRLRGRLDPRWAAWFDGMTVRDEGDGTTVIAGLINDEAALHGLFGRIRDLGISLDSVSRNTPAQPTTNGPNAGQEAEQRRLTR